MTILFFFVYQNVLDWNVESKILAEKIYFDISLPHTFGSDPDFQKYPVIFLAGSHGEKFYQTAVGMIRHLESVERMPRCIIATLAGHTPEIQTNGMWRRRKTIPSYGQSKPFLKALDEEVFPQLQKEFRAADFRIIVGVSGSCLFPLYSFSENPERFQAYILLAAADMIGMGVSDKPFVSYMLEQSKAEHIFFLGYSAEDLYSNGKLKTHYQRSLDQLKKGLKNSNWRYDTRSFDQESHYGILIPGLHQGLNLVFPYEKWNIKYRQHLEKKGQAITSLQQEYTQLSHEYGFSVYPRTERWNSVNSLDWLTSALIREERFEEAMRSAELWVTLSPTLSQGYESQFRILQKLGKHQQAMAKVEETLQKALDMNPEKRLVLWEILKQMRAAKTP